MKKKRIEWSDSSTQEDNDQDDDESDDFDDPFAQTDVQAMNIETCGKSLRRKCSELFFHLQVKLGLKEVRLS